MELWTAGKRNNKNTDNSIWLVLLSTSASNDEELEKATTRTVCRMCLFVCLVLSVCGCEYVVLYFLWGCKSQPKPLPHFWRYKLNCQRTRGEVMEGHVCSRAVQQLPNLPWGRKQTKNTDSIWRRRGLQFYIGQRWILVEGAVRVVLVACPYVSHSVRLSVCHSAI